MSSKSGLWDFCIFTLLMFKVYGPYAPNGTGIFTYIDQKIKPNVGKYSLHGASGWYANYVTKKQMDPMASRRSSYSANHRPKPKGPRWDASKHGQDEERQPREETSHAMADSFIPKRREKSGAHWEGYIPLCCRIGVIYYIVPLFWPSKCI